MGWAILIGHTKRQFQIANVLEVNFKPIFFLNKHFTNVTTCFKMFLWILSYRKKNKFQEIFSMSFGSFMSFQKKKFESLCLSNFIHIFYR